MKRSKQQYKQIIHRDRRERKGGFTCSHCRQWVVINEFMGTANRNHCNMCLWSKHVDIKKGDRMATCQAGMRPVGLTFRIEGMDRRGEIMLIHDCSGCSKLSINRIAADDIAMNVIEVYDTSLSGTDAVMKRTEQGGLIIATEADRAEIMTQLYGYGAA